MRVGIAQPGLDLRHRELARPRRERRARRGRRQRRRSARRVQQPLPAAAIVRVGPERIRPGRLARSTASSRSSQRDGTVGAPSWRVGPGQRTLPARANAWQKSCADEADRAAPAAAEPKACRIGRLIQGSAAPPAGQVPSFRLPRIITSARCSRASSGPQIASRGCRPQRGRTTCPASERIEAASG